MLLLASEGSDLKGLPHMFHDSNLGNVGILPYTDVEPGKCCLCSKGNLSPFMVVFGPANKFCCLSLDPWLLSDRRKCSYR